MLITALSYRYLAVLLALSQPSYTAASTPPFVPLIEQPPAHPLNLTQATTIKTTTTTTCTGSIWCPSFNLPSSRINIYLQDWIKYAMSDADVYAPGAQIACATVTILYPPLGTNAYCAYTRGAHVPAAGINGSVIKRRMEDLRTHGCFACGVTPIAEDESEEPLGDEGEFVINYVPKRKVRCGRPGDVVCPPTVPSPDRAGLEEGPRPALMTFNATVDGDAVTLQALSV